VKLCQLCLSESRNKRQTQMIPFGPDGDYWYCPICDRNTR
jgi:hypothetical protein